MKLQNHLMIKLMCEAIIYSSNVFFPHFTFLDLANEKCRCYLTKANVEKFIWLHWN